MTQPLGFGAFRFDQSTQRLWEGDAEVRLTPRAAAVLDVFVRRPGELVTKDELFATVWQGVAVGDDALTSCIQELRRALGDDAKEPRFIETRHRRGYRFAAPVAPVASDDPAEGEPAREARVGPVAAIAVLPFADMSAARDQDYLCEGLAEELITALTHIDGLRVASRTASFRFRGGADVRDIGRHLGVGALLEGSVRKAGERLRVTVQLVDVDTGYQRWTQRFDRTLDDLFAIQDEIAATVAASLRGRVLTGREAEAVQRPHTSIDAYEWYLRGRQHLPRMTYPDLVTSGEMFERAIALDEGYAPAWAGLATVHATLYEWFGARAADLERARTASERALALASGLVDAVVARGFLLALSGQHDEATQQFEAAIRINPHAFEAYYYYARSSFAHGEIARSADLYRKAADSRLDDFQSQLLLAQSLRMIGRTEEAKAAGDEGIRRAERMLALNPKDGRALSLGAAELVSLGRADDALAWSERSIALYPDDASALLNGTCVRAKLGRTDEALALLTRVIDRGWGNRAWIAHDPDYDSLRDDPRFQKLMARLK